MYVCKAEHWLQIVLYSSFQAALRTRVLTQTGHLDWCLRLLCPGRFQGRTMRKAFDRASLFCDVRRALRDTCTYRKHLARDVSETLPLQPFISTLTEDYSHFLAINTVVVELIAEQFDRWWLTSRHSIDRVDSQ